MFIFSGVVQKLKVDGYNNISVFDIDDFHTTEFNVGNKLFKEQLNKNLTYNFMKNVINMTILFSLNDYYSKPIFNKI